MQLTNLDKIKLELKNNFNKIDIKGSFLIGNEGINGAFSVRRNEFKIATKIINEIFSKSFEYKVQDHHSHAFLRLKIKLKREIVTIGSKTIKPDNLSGKHLTPAEWEKFITNKNIVLIDTRNGYESNIGSFKKSIKVNSKNFREFPEWFRKNKSKFTNKKIAMFCTGGIRCEKASNYVLKSGFSDVYQLKGGIINYLEKTKDRKNFWKGDCFVFDERVSLDKKLKKGKYSQCFACRSPITNKDMMSTLYQAGISCPKCYESKNEKQKLRYSERQKQIKIAKKKGIKHLGF